MADQKFDIWLVWSQDDRGTWLRAVTTGVTRATGYRRAIQNEIDLPMNRTIKVWTEKREANHLYGEGMTA